MTTTPPCDACAAAQADPHSAIYRAGCTTCTARLIAGSPQFHEAAKTKRLTREYMALLAATQVTHAQVKAQAEAMGVLP